MARTVSASRAKAVKVAATPPPVSSLLRRISHQLPVLDARRAGSELYGAPRLNAFVLFAPNENALSRVIGDLLDPQGVHGQGPAFLNSLLHAAGLQRAGGNDPVRVRREVLTAGSRRIDLVIETPRALVGIENKPWAGQQERQLRDYMDALRGWARGRQTALVFLSDQEPGTAKDEVMALPFVSEDDEPSLTSVLEDALQEVRAPRARAHVEELLTYLNWQFGDGAMSDDTEKPYVDAVEAEFAEAGHRKAIAAVLLARDEFHTRILDEIGGHLLASLGGGNGDFEVEDDADLSDAVAEKWSPWLLRRSSWPANLALAIEANNTTFGGICFGVRAPDPKDKEVRSEGAGCIARSALDPVLRAFGGGGRTKWWPWWKWASTRVWQPEYAARLVLNSPSGRVEDHPDVIELSRAMQDLADVIDQTLRG